MEKTVEVNLKNRLQLSDNCVNFSSETKYSDVVVDQKLSLKNHINGVCAEISKNVGVLYRMFHYVPIIVKFC